MEKGDRLWRRKKAYREKHTPKSSWTITLTRTTPTIKPTKPTRKTKRHRKTGVSILVFLKAKAMVGVVTDHYSVFAKKRNALLRHGKTRGAFFTDKYKGQISSVKLSLPLFFCTFILSYSYQNSHRINQRKVSLVKLQECKF